MQTETKTKLSNTTSFIDEAFDARLTNTYQLLVQISIHSVLIAVNEKAKNKYIAFENFTLHNLYSFDSMPDVLDSLAKESKLLNHKYKAVDCIIVNNLSTLIPAALYDDDRKKMYLKFNVNHEGDQLVMVDEIKSIDIKNVFALPIGIKSKFDFMFSNVRFHHASSALINSILLQNKNQTAKRLFVNVQPDHFNAMLIEGKKMVFCNSFNYHSSEDFIYYLLFVYEQLHLNPETIEVVLLGEIEKNSTVYSLTQKYIRTINFGERNDGAQYSYQLQTIPAHYYFTLFNNYYS